MYGDIQCRCHPIFKKWVKCQYPFVCPGLFSASSINRHMPSRWMIAITLPQKTRQNKAKVTDIQGRDWYCCQLYHPVHIFQYFPDSKVHRANKGPIFGRQDPGGPHIGHMNLVIWVIKPSFNDCCDVLQVSYLSKWSIILPHTQLNPTGFHIGITSDYPSNHRFILKIGSNYYIL